MTNPPARPSDEDLKIEAYGGIPADCTVQGCPNNDSEHPAAYLVNGEPRCHEHAKEAFTTIREKSQDLQDLGVSEADLPVRLLDGTQKAIACLLRADWWAASDSDRTRREIREAIRLLGGEVPR